MSTQALPQPVEAGTGGGNHYCCPCDPEVAYCGLDLTGVPETPPTFAYSSNDCPLCVLAAEAHEKCPRCGQ